MIRRDPLAAYTALSRQYGDVVRVRFVLWPTYLLFHPDHVQHVLQEKHTNYSKDLYTYRVLKPVLGEGLATNDGPPWLRQRRLMQPAFNRQRLAAQGEVITAACDAMLRRWEDIARRGAPLDVAAEMRHLTLVIAGQTLFRIDLSGEAENAGAAFEVVNELLADYVYSPLPPFAVPTRRSLRLRAARRTLDRLVFGVIAERRQHGRDSGDLVSALLMARDEQTGEGMTDRQVRDEVMTLLSAGHETTASTLSWALYLLSHHEDVRRRLQAEVAGDGVVTVADLARMPYTTMVLEETLRLYPPAWSFGRKAIRDDEIGGYDIPAGTLVWVSPYVTQRHPRFWERPEEFDPERFTEQQSAMRPRFAHFPFGSGPRICIGSYLAMMVARLVLVSVVRRYRLRLAPGARVEPEAQLTLRPRHGLPMVLEPA